MTTTELDDIHECEEGCPLDGMIERDVMQITFALSCFYDHRDDLETTAFRDDNDDVHVLITTNYGGQRAVVGVIWGPGIYDSLRASGTASQVVIPVN